MRVSAGDAVGTFGDPRSLGGLRSLHGFHWLVVGLSLVLTASAWWFSRGLVDDRAASRFERETDHLVELVTERMSRYEDALQAGVAAISARGGSIDRSSWRDFTDTLDIERRYPGINGLGVIRHARADELDALVARERRQYPGFDVHPEVEATEHFPIIHVEPLAKNRAALGLDLAHEPRRLAGALEAARTGEPRITAPIVLVQDALDTPGFLFFVPWTTVDESGDGRRFEGFVYAPFIVRSLMADVLDQSRRQAWISITDDGESIHDEHDPDAPGRDPEPLFTRIIDVPLHGRTWRFDVRTNLDFREAVAMHQPTFVLIAGLVIDLMLLGLFVGLSRAHRAMRQVAVMNTELQRKAAALAETNLDLERFACVVSHDLKTPLRGIGDIAWYLEEDLGPVLAAPDAPHGVAQNLERLNTQVRRMNGLIAGILDYSAAGTGTVRGEWVDSRVVFEEIAGELELEPRQLVLEGEMPAFVTCRVRFEQVMSNIVGNAFKYHPVRAEAIVRVRIRSSGTHYRFSIVDNGPGIEPRYRERIFEMFQTLQPKDAIESTGVGLSIVRKCVESVGGTVRVDANPRGGAIFHVEWPKALSPAQDVVTAAPRYPSHSARRKAP